MDENDRLKGLRLLGKTIKKINRKLALTGAKNLDKAKAKNQLIVSAVKESVKEIQDMMSADYALAKAGLSIWAARIKEYKNIFKRDTLYLIGKGEKSKTRITTPVELLEQTSAIFLKESEEVSKIKEDSGSGFQRPPT
jgi:hypothetical protein